MARQHRSPDHSDITVTQRLAEMARQHDQAPHHAVQLRADCRQLRPPKCPSAPLNCAQNAHETPRMCIQRDRNSQTRIQPEAQNCIRRGIPRAFALHQPCISRAFPNASWSADAARWPSKPTHTEPCFGGRNFPGQFFLSAVERRFASYSRHPERSPRRGISLAPKRQDVLPAQARGLVKDILNSLFLRAKSPALWNASA